MNATVLINKYERKNILSPKFLETMFNIILVVTTYFLCLIHLYNSTSYKQVIITLSILLLIFYINTFLITPLIFKLNKYIRYTLIGAFLLAIYSTSYFQAGSLFGAFTGGIPAAPLLFILFSSSFIYGHIHIKLKTKEQFFNLKLGAKNSELQLLKSQVNPHFLFNTLNTLYATALEENAPKTGESTAKLANLIRYMQEDINKDFIPLENEIKYLQDYITIQKLRCEIEPQIETTFKNIAGKRVSPGLLIPFVENAFKHGIDPSKPSKLKVSVICDENTILFECINSYNDDFKTYHKEQGFGIGINNAKQRLQLVYPKNHTFQVEKENNIFLVKISITTK